jgi:alkylation response protein AidB-like acyl-CoA dehydrogenase
MLAVREMTNAYLLERETYGRQIGSYQALQFNMADMYMATETAKELTYRAAWMVQEGLPQAAEFVAMAKGWISEKYKWVSERGIQLHGAIATSRDHDASLYYRRARILDMTLGDVDSCREAVAVRSLGL